MHIVSFISRIAINPAHWVFVWHRNLKQARSVITSPQPNLSGSPHDVAVVEAPVDREPAEEQMSRIKVESDGGLTVVSLTRPDALNAIDEVMVDELHTVCATLERSPQVLIIAGCETPKGAVFASGADIAELRGRGPGDALRGINSRVLSRISDLPMPVIAAIDGVAFGGGAELAYAADFRLATPRSRIGNPEPKLGIMAAAGATWRLAALVGEPLAKEILLAGRVMNAEEAHAAHLFTELCTPETLMTRAKELARKILDLDGLAVRVTKKVMSAGPDAHPFIDDLAQGMLFGSPARDHRMDAFLTRRFGAKES